MKTVLRQRRKRGVGGESTPGWLDLNGEERECWEWRREREAKDKAGISYEEVNVRQGYM